MDEAREERNNVDESMTGISTNSISSLNTRQAQSLPGNVFLKNTADEDSQHSRMESRVGRVISLMTIFQ